jgi:hypothetical protein
MQVGSVPSTAVAQWVCFACAAVFIPALKGGGSGCCVVCLPASGGCQPLIWGVALPALTSVTVQSREVCVLAWLCANRIVVRQQNGGAVLTERTPVPCRWHTVAVTCPLCWVVAATLQGVVADQEGVGLLQLIMSCVTAPHTVLAADLFHNVYVALLGLNVPASRMHTVVHCPHACTRICPMDGCPVATQ